MPSPAPASWLAENWVGLLVALGLLLWFLRPLFLRHYYKQFGNPSGLMGRLVGGVLSQDAGRRAMSLETVERLDILPDDRVLEIGCGPGLALAWAAERATRGLVVGVDHSEQMRHLAAERNADLIAQGRVRLLLDDVEALTPRDGEYDKIFGVNVWMFLKKPVETLRRLRALLAPGGTLVLSGLPGDGDFNLGAAALSRLFERAGLEPFTVDLLTPDSGAFLYACYRAPEEDGRDHA